MTSQKHTQRHEMRRLSRLIEAITDPETIALAMLAVAAALIALAIVTIAVA